MANLKRLPRPLRWLVLGVSYLALGLIALVALVMVAVNVPLVSNFIAGKVTSALEPSFKGRVVLHRLGYIDFGGVLGAEAEVFDPAGHSVLGARNVDVRVFWPGLVWQMLTGSSEETTIGIDRIAVEHVRVELVDDGSGSPTLAQAFEPREPKTEPEEPATTSLILREIEVDSIEVRGALASPGPIDADLAHLLASLESRPESLHLTLARADVTARQLPQVDRLSGRLTAEVTLPATATAPPSGAPAPVAENDPTATTTYALRPEPLSRRITAAFAGEVAGSGASMQLRMLGEELRAELEAPALSPDTLKQLAPGISPQGPAGLVARVEGTLDDFGFDARVSQEAALVTATGRVRQHEGKSSVQAHLDAARVNVSRIVSGALDTDLSLGADARLTFDESGGKGDYRVVTGTSRVGPERLPRAQLEGEVSLPSEKPVVTSGTLNIDEPGAATEIRYQVEARDAGVRAEVSSRTELRQPARLAALSGGLSGTGELTTKVLFDAADERLDARFELDLSRVKHPEVAARRVRVSGRAEGDMLLPKLDVTAKLSGVSAGGRRFSAVRIAARGTPSRLQLTATADGSNPNRIRVAATLLNGSELAVRDADVRVTDERGNLQLRAKQVAFPPGKIRVDELTLDGPGHAELSLRYGRSLEHLVLKTDRLNAARLLDIVGVKSPLRGGQLTVQAELSGRGALPNGKLDIDLTDLEVGKLKGAQAHAKLVLDRGKVSGTAEIELARGAKTSISVKDMNIPLGAGSAEVGSMTGDVSIDGEIDLKQLEGLVSLTGLERAEGKVRLNVALERPVGDATPTWRAHIETKGLVLVQKRPDVDQNQSAEQAQRTSPLWVRGIDLEVDAALEKDSANVQGKLFDRQGDLVRIEAKWKGLGGLGNPARLREKFQAAPFTARVEVPPRAFEKFPAPIRPTEITGVFSLGVEAEGTLLHPSVRTRGRIERFGAASERRRAPRLDLELAADYAQAGGSVQLRAHDRQHPLLELASSWKGDAALLAAQLDGKSPIVGNVELTLDEFPVELIPALDTRQIRGKVSGKMRLDELGKDARLLLDVTTRNLRVDRLRVDQVKTLVQTKDGRLVVRASIAGQAGAADAELETGVDWGNRIVPTLDEQLKGSLRTQKFRLSALQPLVEGSVSELDGKLDAEIRAVMDGASPRLSGQLELKEGILHLPSVGQRFHDMSANVKISPEAIVLEKLRARGTSGGFEADAEAKLDGLTPTAATLNLRIKESDKLPLTVEGEAVGDGWGNIVVRYNHDEAAKKDTLLVRLDQFNIELPQSPPRGIQDLNQPEHVRVGFNRKDREFVPIPLQPLKEPGAPSEYETVVVVELGSVRVEKGQQAEVALGGEVRAKLGEELDVQGKVETRRGSLDISGKKFEIERGTVTFTGGKPDDPTISAVARYDSPDGYTVYAEYTGTVNEGKLRLSSEPALSQDEILTLLMFGTPDGSVGAGSGGSLATAVSVAGGTAAQGLNRALSDVTDLDVSARIDTSTGAPRPELVLQLTSRVAAKVTQALGEPSPGQSPDRTFLTIELRLASAWSLSTMIGDRGASALDLIWRKRY